jgi:hypothetical protein
MINKRDFVNRAYHFGRKDSDNKMALRYLSMCETIHLNECERLNSSHPQ